MSRRLDTDKLVVHAPQKIEGKPRVYLGFTFLVFRIIIPIISFAAIILCVVGFVLFLISPENLVYRKVLAAGTVSCGLIMIYAIARFMIRS